MTAGLLVIMGSGETAPTMIKPHREIFARFFHLMLAEGVYLPPSQLESAFFCAAHAKKDIVQLIERVDRALKKLAWEFST